MYWSDVAMILFSCVAANHLGLISAIEKTTGYELIIINCSRCFTYWSVLMYSLFITNSILLSFATSFLAAVLAPWIEMLMGFIDNLYNKLYDTIYPATENDRNGETESKKDS